MDRRWIYLGVTALVFFLGALVLRMPAAWVLAGANRLLPAEIGWTGSSGGISGMVVRGLTFGLPGGRRVWFNEVMLEPALLPLFGGSLGLDFRIDDGGGRLAGSASAGLNRWRLEEIDGKLPLTALLPTFPELEIAGLAGEVSIRGEAVSAEYGALPSGGRLILRFGDIHAAWLQTDELLGNYQVELQAIEESGITGELRTLGGPALLSLSGRFTQDTPAQTLRFRGSGRLSPDAPVPLRRMLPILGRAGRGSRRNGVATRA